MSDPKLALRQLFQFHVAVFVALTWFSLVEYAALAETTDHTKLFPEQNEGNFTIIIVQLFTN